MKSNAPFCCDEHQEQHKSEAVTRLLEYREAKPAPLVEEDPIHRFAAMNVEPREAISKKWELQPVRALEARRYTPMRKPFSDFYGPPGLMTPRLRWAPAPDALLLWPTNIRPVAATKPAPRPAPKRAAPEPRRPIPAAQPVYTLSEIFLGEGIPLAKKAAAGVRLSPEVSIAPTGLQPAMGLPGFCAWLPPVALKGLRSFSRTQSWMDSAVPITPCAGVAGIPAGAGWQEIPVFRSAKVAMPWLPREAGLPGGGLAGVRPALNLAPLGLSAAAAGDAQGAAGEVGQAALCSPAPMVWGFEPGSLGSVPFAVPRRQPVSFCEAATQWRESGAPPLHPPAFELRLDRSHWSIGLPALPRPRDLGSLRALRTSPKAQAASLRLPDPSLLVPSLNLLPQVREETSRAILQALAISLPATPAGVNALPRPLGSRRPGAMATPLKEILSPRLQAAHPFGSLPSALEPAQPMRGLPAGILRPLPVGPAGSPGTVFIEAPVAPKFPQSQPLGFSSEALQLTLTPGIPGFHHPAGISRFSSSRGLATMQAGWPAHREGAATPVLAKQIYGLEIRLRLPDDRIAPSRVQPHYGARQKAEARAVKTPPPSADAAGYILLRPSPRAMENPAVLQGSLAALAPPPATCMPGKSGAAILTVAARIVLVERLAPTEARCAPASGDAGSAACEAAPAPVTISPGVPFGLPKWRRVLSPVLSAIEAWPAPHELPTVQQAPCGLLAPSGLVESYGRLPAPAASSLPRPRAPRAAPNLRETAFGPAALRTPPAADPLAVPRPVRPVAPVPVQIAPVDAEATDDLFEVVAPRPQPAMPPPAPTPAPAQRDALREAAERVQQSKESRLLRLAEQARTIWHDLLQPALATRQGRVAAGAVASILILGVGLHLAGGALKSSTTALLRPLSQRAYFVLEEDFQSGFKAWTTPDALARRDDGLMETQQGLTLYRPSLDRTDYEFEFSGLVGEGALGWAVRAADMQNYYAFKLTWEGKGKAQRGVLVRYPVVGGAPTEKPQLVALPFDLAKNKLYEVTVDVAGGRITTMIDGRGVDSCANLKFPSGGIGFFADEGERGAIHSASISGNDDGTGRLLQWLKGFYQFLTNKG